MPLLVVVALLIVVGVVWRARATRRLTIEESVDRYRRTLSAVHDATVRSREGDRATPPTPAFSPRPNRALGPPSGRLVAVAVAAALTLVVVAIVVTHHGGKGQARSQSTTTTHPRPPRTTTTTVAAPTTTVPLVRAADLTGTAFNIATPNFTLVLRSNTGDCWVDARDPAGASLFTGLLSNGTSQTLTTANATVRLGNPAAVSVTVDGAPVPFVTHNDAPVTLHFQGATA